eukprot:Sdes_comp18565_c0_seq1m8663
MNSFWSSPYSNFFQLGIDPFWNPLIFIFSTSLSPIQEGKEFLLPTGSENNSSEYSFLRFQLLPLKLQQLFVSLFSHPFIYRHIQTQSISDFFHQLHCFVSDSWIQFMVQNILKIISHKNSLENNLPLLKNSPGTFPQFSWLHRSPRLHGRVSSSIKEEIFCHQNGTQKGKEHYFTHECSPHKSPSPSAPTQMSGSPMTASYDDIHHDSSESSWNILSLQSFLETIFAMTPANRLQFVEAIQTRGSIYQEVEEKMNLFLEAPTKSVELVLSQFAEKISNHVFLETLPWLLRIYGIVCVKASYFTNLLFVRTFLFPYVSQMNCCVSNSFLEDIFHFSKYFHKEIMEGLFLPLLLSDQISSFHADFLLRIVKESHKERVFSDSDYINLFHQITAKSRIDPIDNQLIWTWTNPLLSVLTPLMSLCPLFKSDSFCSDFVSTLEIQSNSLHSNSKFSALLLKFLKEFGKMLKSPALHIMEKIVCQNSTILKTALAKEYEKTILDHHS